MLEPSKPSRNYLTWPLVDVPCGLPKDERLKVRTQPTDDRIVAETVTETGAIRETEVLFRNLRDDGQLDFAAYNRNGLLMDRSTFATRGGTPTTFGAPFICVSCHMGGANVDVQHPDGLGAGCEGGADTAAVHFTILQQPRSQRALGNSNGPGLVISTRSTSVTPPWRSTVKIRFPPWTTHASDSASFVEGVYVLSASQSSRSMPGMGGTSNTCISQFWTDGQFRNP